MGNLDISASRGSIRINYAETVDKTAQTSLITITSVQVMSTSHYQYPFQPEGKITLGNQTITLTPSNAVYVGSTNTWYTFSNVPSISYTFSNDGSGKSATVTLGSNPGYGDFNVFCNGNSVGNIEISTGARSISLTKYETDSASTISVPSAVTLGNNLNITIAAAKTSYTHTLQYSFNNSTWTNITTTASGGTYVWDTDNVSGKFSTLATRTCYLRCITYNGGSQIGSAASTSTTITATGTPSISSISITPVNDNSTIKSWNNGNIFVQGFTRAGISINYSLPSGTSLSVCRISMNGNVVSEGAVDNVTTASPITEAGSVSVSVTIVDSRGNSATTSSSINVYPYSRPYAIQASAIRYSNNVNTEDKENGTNISAKATISYSSINGYNSARVTAKYKAAGGTYPTTSTTLTSGAANYAKINSSAVSAEQSYTVQFIISDALHPANEDPTTIEITIPTRAVVLHARDGGTGLAIGGYSTEGKNNAFEVFWDTFLSDTYLGGVLILPDKMYGASEPNVNNAKIGQVYFQLID